jgi:CRP/FNR family transcriptional regulator, cyclic AMP receptor protein
MTLVDAIGWLAAALTLLTFATRDMVVLRLMALGANTAFIVYGMAGQLWPVVVLHVTLLPLNAVRLLELRRATLWRSRETSRH